MPQPLPPASSEFLAQALRNPANAAILDRWDALRLPDGWLVAGYLFYFDPADLSGSGENAVQARVEDAVRDLGITAEAKNQARVHL
jgi:hypothetical protein